MRTIPIALVCAAALLGGAPIAGAAPRLRQVRLAIEITGLQVVDWHRQDEGFPDPARAWISGSGTQTLGFSTPRPVTYLASIFSGRLRSGEHVSPLALTPLHAPRPLKGSLRRSGDWHHGDGVSCDREGGCDDGLVVPLHQTPSCPDKRVGVSAVLATERDRVVLKSEAPNPAGLWPNCPPDMEGERTDLLGLPGELTLPGATRRIAGLARGRTATLKARLDSSCPPLTGVGFQQCAVTDVTVEVTRVR